MFLKRIELQGFKSFAEKTVIQFDHDITGIVGPNGCGKSNVNDAIRWVLGEQSTKSLRSGTSMSDIIFSGSAYRKPVNLAKVTLVFDNSQRIFDSDFEEIEITRQIQRSNNEASYFINKAPCRLKDINELVMDTGLGRDSLSIITQGNISSFADAKPEERRSLFEEAAGVAKYKKRKQVSLKKLEKTKENLDRVQDIIEELERQLKPLANQAKKAEAYLGFQEELSKIEVSVLVEQIASYHEKIQSIQSKLASNESSYLSQNEQVEQLDQDIASMRKEMYALDAKINKLQGEYTQAMSESYQLEKRKIELDEKRKYALSQADQEQKERQLAQLLKEAKYEYEDRSKRLEQMKKEMLEANTWIDQQQSQVNRQDYELSQLRSRYQQLINREHLLKNMIAQPYQQQAGLKSIMQAKNSLHGIEGVISDLLLAKKDKAQALQAALGGSMYQIVTKDEESARYAIRFLKRNKSGRATFLPLTVCKPKSLNAQQETIASTCPGYIAFANHCVECDEKYEVVRDRLLGNIVVMDSLENANECAKRLSYRVKIVTLDGEIVHAGGSMTGGRGKNQSSPVTMKQELASVQEKIKESKNQLEECEAKLSQLEKKLESKKQERVDLKVDLGRLESVYEVKKQKYESLKDEYSQISDQQEEEILEDEIVIQTSKMHAKIDELTSSMKSLRQRRYEMGEQVEEKENKVRSLRRENNVLQTEIHSLDVSLTKYKAEMDHALNRLNSDYQMTYEYACTQKQEIDLEQAQDRVTYLRLEISKLGHVNLDAPNEYKELKERYEFLLNQKEDLEAASQQILDAIDEMDQTMMDQFCEMFDKINQELDGVFKAMFGGGHAKLVMVDPDDVLNTGIDIDVQPPGKMVKNIQTFSGGEKALIAISVLFSILRARTMPLCIFDEVEAALDQANVERFARYIGRFRGQSQFIVVTHRPGTMEQCDTLYGVTMQKDGVSQLLKVELRDAMDIAKKEDSNGLVSKH